MGYATKRSHPSKTTSRRPTKRRRSLPRAGNPYPKGSKEAFAWIARRLKKQVRRIQKKHPSKD
jgi:hypothetical protein